MLLHKPRFALLFSLLVFLTSCHSDYISLSYQIHHGAAWNDNNTHIALFITTEAYRAPKGVARFPDGGQSKTVFTETALYLFQPETNTINKASRIDSLPVRWNAKIVYTDSMVYYYISPTTEWEQQLQSAKTETDSVRIFSLKEAYSKPFVFNERTKKTGRVDSSNFSNFYSEEKRADLQALYNQIEEIPLAHLGLVLQKIYPKPDKEYINDFIYSSQGGSALTKRAIAEQIISTLSESEIRTILKRISDYADSLEGLEKQSFELNSEDKFELLKKLL